MIMNMAFGLMVAILAVGVLARLANAISKHWVGLLEISFMIFATMIGRGWKGFEFSVFVVMAINVVLFVKKKIEETALRKELHVSKINTPVRSLWITRHWLGVTESIIAAYILLSGKGFKTFEVYVYVIVILNIVMFIIKKIRNKKIMQ